MIWLDTAMLKKDEKTVLGKAVLNNKINNQKGSMTLETSIVFCAIFFCVIAVIYMCLLIYHQTCNEALAEKTSRKAAATWNNIDEDMFIKKKTIQELSNNQLYEEIIDAQIDKKRLKALKYIAFYHNPFKVLKSDNSCVEIKIQNSIVNRKIEISILEQYKIPIGEILNTIGIENIFKFSAKSKSFINKPTGFINNTDFIIETYNEIDRKYLNEKMNEKLRGISEKFDVIFKKIKTITNK